MECMVSCAACSHSSVDLYKLCTDFLLNKTDALSKSHESVVKPITIKVLSSFAKFVNHMSPSLTRLSVTGVSQAVEHINSTIAPALVDQVRKKILLHLFCGLKTVGVVYFCFLLLLPQDLSVVEQESIDQIMIDMDGTENKCK